MGLLSARTQTHTRTHTHSGIPRYFDGASLVCRDALFQRLVPTHARTHTHTHTHRHSHTHTQTERDRHSDIPRGLDDACLGCRDALVEMLVYPLVHPHIHTERRLVLNRSKRSSPWALARERERDVWSSIGLRDHLHGL